MSLSEAGSAPAVVAGSPLVRERAAHRVRFYERDRFPVDLVAEHLASHLRFGAAIAIVTAAHAQLVRAALAARGVGVDGEIAAGRLELVDAEDLLRELTVGDPPSEVAFARMIDERVRAPLARFGALGLFGELVDLLSRRGDGAAAVRVEEMWAGIVARHPSIDVLCAYDLASIAHPSAAGLLDAVCAAHDHGGAGSPAAGDRFLVQAARLFASSLDVETTVARAAQLPVPAFADWAFVDLLTDDGASFDRVAVGHHRPDGEAVARAHMRRYAMRAGEPGVAAAVEQRRPLLLRRVDDALLRGAAHDPEHLAAAQALEARSVIVAPMVARGRVLGALTLVSCVRAYDDVDVAFVEQLALSAAAGIANARLFDGEHRARVRIGNMHQITAALSGASTVDEVAATTCRIGAEVTQARSGALWLGTPDGALGLAGSWGTPREFIEQFRRIEPDADAPANVVARTASPMWIQTEDDCRRVSPAVHDVARVAGRLAAYGAVPLHAVGGVPGVLVFSHRLGHVYDDDERAFYVTLGQHCAQALERARLLDAERRSNDRLRLLARAGEALSGTLDLGETLRQVARLVVPVFADWCVMDLVDGDDIRRVVTHHSVPAKVERAERVAAGRTRRVGDGSPIACVIAEGRSRHRARIPIEALRAAAFDDEELARMQAEGLVSAVVVPLIARGACIGALSLATAESERVYDLEDVAFAEELGRRAAVAIANGRMHHALEEAEERLRLALDAGEVGAWDLDLATGRVVCDARCRAIYGYGPDVVVDRASVLKLVHPEDVESAWSERSRASDPTKGGELAMEYRIHRASDGALRWVATRGRAFFERGEVRRMVGTIVDVTDLKLADARRAESLERERAARADAEAANRIKDEFLATVSHELRTPLNAILGWATLLRERRPLDPGVAKAVDVIHRNAKAQTRLVEDILDVSRIITGKLLLDAAPVDLVALARDAIEVVRPSAAAKGLAVEIVACSPAAVVVGDAERLRQVVWNLLSNAVKFTDADGRVTVAVEQDGARVSLVVRDTGRGIEPEFLPYVFDRFKQADSSTTRRFGGLGLGLAIVRHLVELHGGHVDAESAGKGKGAAFRVTLPVRATAPRAEPTAASEVARAAPGASASLDGARVLVVDDDDDSRELLRDVLAGAGAIVETAESAAAGFAALRRARPDVLVSDVGMPDEDGYAFVRRVRAVAEGRDLPAIALTAYTRSEDRAKALDAGFDAHLAKPVDPDDLIAAIARVRRPRASATSVDAARGASVDMNG